MIIADWGLILKITKWLSEDVNRRRTDNTMAKRRRTDNTMAKRRRTDNTMAKRQTKDKQKTNKIKTMMSKALHKKLKILRNKLINS